MNCNLECLHYNISRQHNGDYPIRTLHSTGLNHPISKWQPNVVIEYIRTLTFWAEPQYIGLRCTIIASKHCNKYKLLVTVVTKRSTTSIKSLNCSQRWYNDVCICFLLDSIKHSTNPSPAIQTPEKPQMLTTFQAVLEISFQYLAYDSVKCID